MTTDSLLSIQPALAGFNPSATGAASASLPDGEGSEAFLKALVDKIKGLSPDALVGAEAAVIPQSAQAGQPSAAAPIPMDEFTAFIEQIKVLAGQAAISKTADGNQGIEDGNLLPLQAAGEGEALPLTTAQLEQLVNQLLGRTAAPVKTQAQAETSANQRTVEEAAAPTLLTTPATAVTDASQTSTALSSRPNPNASKEESREFGETAATANDAAALSIAMPPPLQAPVPMVDPQPVPAQNTEVSLSVPVAQPSAASALPEQSALNTGTVESAAPQAAVPGTSTQSAPATEMNEARQAEQPPVVQEVAVAAASVLNAAMGAAVPVSPSPVASAVVAAFKNDGPAAATPTLSGKAPGMDSLGSSLDEMALTPELLKLVAAKAGKPGSGETSFLAQPLASPSQGPLMSEALPDGFELGAIPQGMPQDMRSAVQPPQAGVPPMSTPFGRPDWSDDFGERVVWMTGKGIQSAELQLNPQHLGPVEVRINLNQDQASVQFVAHNPAVRDAIEAAIPKLREMLGAQQLNLADVSVAQQSFQDPRDYRGAQQAYDQQSQSSGRGVDYPGGNAGEEAGLREGETVISHQKGRGLLNLYA